MAERPAATTPWRAIPRLTHARAVGCPGGAAPGPGLAHRLDLDGRISPITFAPVSSSWTPAGCRHRTRSRSRPAACPGSISSGRPRRCSARSSGLGGWALLAVVRAALVGLVAWLVFRACRSSGAGTRVAAWLTLAGFARRARRTRAAAAASRHGPVRGHAGDPRGARATTQPRLGDPAARPRLGQRPRVVLPGTGGGRRRLARRRRESTRPGARRLLAVAIVSTGATILSPYRGRRLELRGWGSPRTRRSDASSPSGRPRRRCRSSA